MMPDLAIFSLSCAMKGGSQEVENYTLSYNSFYSNLMSLTCVIETSWCFEFLPRRECGLSLTPSGKRSIFWRENLNSEAKTRLKKMWTAESAVCVLSRRMRHGSTPFLVSSSRQLNPDKCSKGFAIILFTSIFSVSWTVLEISSTIGKAGRTGGRVSAYFYELPLRTRVALPQ